MKVLSKKQPQETSKEVSLATRIEETRTAAEQYIERYVDRLKASDDGKLLPRDWLLLDTRLQFGKCNCQCALALLEREYGKR